VGNVKACCSTILSKAGHCQALTTWNNRKVSSSSANDDAAVGNSATNDNLPNGEVKSLVFSHAAVLEFEINGRGAAPSIAIGRVLVRERVVLYGLRRVRHVTRH
jgi:hypothetical protein